MSNKKTPKKKMRRRFHGFRFLTTLLIIAVCFELIFGVLAFRGLTTFLKDKPTLYINDFDSQQSTLIYDANGDQIADIGTQLRENITYEQIPESLIDAFLSIEDSRYFSHNGFDIPRFSKAIIETLARGNMQGGSTFTMQLVKLTYFENDSDGTSRTKDIEYKLQQIALAMELEKQTDKKSIIELYLNKMNFGGVGNIRGIEKACNQYFNKSTNELNLSESALLAGIVNAPYYYNPYTYLDHATERRNEVLNYMVMHGYITEEENQMAKNIRVEDLLVSPSNMSNQGYTRYQAYIDEVIKEAEKVTGQDPLNVSMEIYTAMRPDIQDLIETIEKEEYPGINFWDENMELAILSLNNQNGEIVGIGGGRNYVSGGSMLLNHATEQFNQPGSSCKPFLDYALAFEYLGWATDHVITDKPVNLGNWVFRNASGYYTGDIKIPDALAMSLNTPAIQAMQEVIDAVGVDVVYEYLDNLQFEMFDRSNFDISYSIGAGNFRASVKEMAAASGVIVANGNYFEPHTITKIVYRSGSREDLVPTYTGKQVLSPQAAYLTSLLMKNNVDVSGSLFNYMHPLRKAYPVYGKTGTTDWGSDGLQYGIPQGAAKDRWMIAQTTQYTTAIWLGYEKASTEHISYMTDYYQSMQVDGNIHSVMLDALNNGEPPQATVRPEGISDITHILGIFPYVKPIAGMPSEYITTGLVKSEYASLGEPQGKTALDTLSTFTAEVGESEVTLNWDAYPHPDSLTEAPTSKDISLRDANGGIMAAATGKRLFDYSWVWGAVRYKARIEQNGETITEIESESESTTVPLSDLHPDTETKVCGFYGYSKSEDVSNEICTTFTTPKTKVIAPEKDAGVNVVQDWVNANQLTITVFYVEEDRKNPAGTIVIKQKGKNVNGKEVNIKDPIEIYIYEEAFIPDNNNDEGGD